MSTNNEGPVLPIPTGNGLMRDWFATAYMQALCSTQFYTDGNLMDSEVAKHAYVMADAMLEARKR